MKTKLGVLLLASSAMIVPAAAQQGQPNPAQAAAKALLQAADKAIGAEVLHHYRNRLDGLSGPAVRPRRPAARGLEELYGDP
jgi:hypothetical protein